MFRVVVKCRHEQISPVCFRRRFGRWFSLRLRLRSYIRCREGDPGRIRAFGVLARARRVRGAYRHALRRVSGRKAERQVRTPSDSLGDGGSLPRFGSRLRVHSDWRRRPPCARMVPLHRRTRHRRRFRRGSALHRRNRAWQVAWASRGLEPVQHRLRHPRELRHQLPRRALHARLRPSPRVGLCAWGALRTRQGFSRA